MVPEPFPPADSVAMPASEGRTLADADELRALAERYALALDLVEADDYLGVFTEDAVEVVRGVDGTAAQERRGAAELLKEFDELARLTQVFHLASGHVTQVSADGRTATAVVSAGAPPLRPRPRRPRQ